MTTTKMSPREQREAERAAWVKEARDLVAGAKSAARDLTGDEAARVDELMGAIDEYDEFKKSAAAAQARFDQVRALGPVSDDAPAVKSFDAAAVKSQLERALRTNTATAWELPDLKAALNSTTLNLPTQGTDVAAAPATTAAFRLASLFPNVAAAGPSVRYYSMGAATADIVPELGTKPDAGISATPHDVQVVKIANLVRVSDELREDADAVWQAIVGECSLGVLRRENAYVATTLLSASGGLTATGTKADVLAVVAGAIGASEALNGIGPDVLVANPVDLAALRQLKTTAGQPLIDPLSAGPAQLYGLRLQASASLTSGTMLLVSGRAATFYVRSGLRFETAFTGTDFETNALTGRCEERVLLAPLRPSLVTKITLS